MPAPTENPRPKASEAKASEASRPAEPVTTEPVTTAPAVPLLRVINSDATPEEVAALVAVFASLGGGETPAPRRTSEWQAHHRKLRTPVPHGPGGWRSSALPR